MFNKQVSSSGKDFDDMLAMGDDCDLRKKGDDSTVDSSVEQNTEDKVNQQTSF